MTNIDILIFVIAILLALSPLAAIVFWIVYRARKQRSFKRGMVCFENRQYSQALYYFGQAERDWGINIAHKTPKTILKDLDRLDLIISKVAEAAKECGHIVDIDKLHDMIKARREIWSNRKYLKFGSCSLKDAILERDRQIVNSIESMRYQLRRIYPFKPNA
jgi:hypothetical protein